MSEPTPITDALSNEIANEEGAENAYTDEMVDRIWMLCEELERTLAAQRTAPPAPDEDGSGWIGWRKWS